MIVQLIDYLKARMRLVKIFCLIGIGMIVIWSLTLDTSHVELAVEKFPVFWGIFGFLASVVITFFAYWLGKSVKTREDYYDK